MQCKGVARGLSLHKNRQIDFVLVTVLAIFRPKVLAKGVTRYSANVHFSLE